MELEDPEKITNNIIDEFLITTKLKEFGFLKGPDKCKYGNKKLNIQKFKNK